MTAKYFAILTNYGAAQLANAVALGTQMNISAMAVGDGGGTLPVPDPAQTKLIRETRRAAVNQVSIDEKNPNFIIAEQVIPENEGGWFIREIGLFDDNGGLIAVGNAPETYKPNLQEGSGRTQVIQMVLMVSSTQAITLKIDPSVVLATREYVTKSIDAAIQASEDRAAQTYQPKGDYVTNPYLKIELLKKIDKADIAQQLGNDTGKVVSQNLLTTELGKKASVADANSKLAKDQNGADIPDKPKFIENLGLKELYLALTGGTLTGPLFIRKDGPAFVISPVTENGSSYIQGRNNNNKATWFIGNPTDGGTAIYFRNYITGAEVSLHANGISLNQNTYINGTLELTNYSTFDARYSKIRTVLKSDNGYEKDENTGLIRQWGKTPAFGAGNGSPVKFPIPFPSKCVGVSALPIRDSASSAGSAETIYCGAPGLSGVQLYLGGTINYPVYWEAWGY
ncbi:phage tail-collar fiber domain-containing protein [Morganella morganii]|uniref:phage tail-collar fiber domain-containing protein n=2 Tax=Morganella morganii TaxID=582 RepID=UPI0021A7B150|nr:phage tail protein [Morganella morganii]